jgi:predicted 3-demethylubiquinone-9 3-methyltransferase (glyoxalase superfamily)
MKKISSCLWFDHQAEEAATFYTSISKNSKILMTTRYGEAGSKVSGQPQGSVMTVKFELNGQEFVALNGGAIFKFTAFRRNQPFRY